MAAEKKFLRKKIQLFSILMLVSVGKTDSHEIKHVYKQVKIGQIESHELTSSESEKLRALLLIMMAMRLFIFLTAASPIIDCFTLKLFSLLDPVAIDDSEQ